MIILKLVFCLVFVATLPGLGLAFFISRKSESFNLIDDLFLSLILSPILLISLSFIENFVGINLLTPELLLNLLIINLLSLFIVSKYKSTLSPKRLTASFNIPRALVYLGFLIIFGVRIISIIKLQTPILHDPISHTEWLKFLTNSGSTTTSNWYPQGLEYYLQYFTRLGEISSAKAVLYGTNIFLSLIPISLYYAIKLVKRGYESLFAIGALVISSIVAMPNYLFATSGKNSMIIAFALVPIALCYIYKNDNEPIDNALLSLIIFAIFTIHYPTGVFVYLLWGVNFIKTAAQSLKKFKKFVIDNLGFIISTPTLLLLAFIKIYPLYKAFPASNDKSVSAIVSAIHAFGIGQFVVNDFFNYQVSLYGVIAMVFFVGSGFLYLFTKKKIINDMIFNLIVGFSIIYFIFSLLFKLPDKTLAIFLNLEVRFFMFFILMLLSAWFVQFISDFFKGKTGANLNIYIYVVLAIMFLAGNIMVFNKFMEAGKNYSTVSEKDISAFNFINANIPVNDLILVQMAKGNGVVMPTDSGAWISSFTKNKIEVDFSDFSKPFSEKIFEQYQKINKGNGALSTLYCSYNIRYIFFGSKAVFGQPLAKSKLEMTRLVQKIYDNGATVYRLDPQSCSSQKK